MVIVRIVIDIVVAGTVKVEVIVVFACVGSFGVDIIVVVVRFCPFDVVSGGVENNSVPNNSVGLPNISGCYFEAKRTKHSKDFACSTLTRIIR